MNIGLHIFFQINVMNFFKMNSLWSFYLMVYLGLYPQVDQVALGYLFLFEQYKADRVSEAESSFHGG